MAEPIIELIAQELVEKLNEITVINGFSQDIRAGRAKQVDFDMLEEWLLNGNAPYSNGDVLVSQAEDDEDEKGAQKMHSWQQPFDITCFILISDKATESPDTNINRARADILKKLFENDGRFSNEMGFIGKVKTSIFRGRGFSGVNINIIVNYRHQLRDPKTL